MFIEAFKDYLDYLHELSSLLSGDIGVFGIIKSMIIYVTQSIGVLFWYIISFKWLFDFVEIPALFRQTYTAILNSNSVFDGRYELNLDQGFFSLLDLGNFNSNNLGTGFLNSFFVTLPLSISQLLTLRALMVNGVPAAVFSALGSLIGQFVFFTCVLFGLEFILVPWVSIQPFLILVGTFIVVTVVHDLYHNPPLQPITASQRPILFKYFRTTLSLSWLEQICVYSYLGNLTVNGASTVFQTSEQNFLFSTFGYLLGLTIGSVFWTVLWGFGAMGLRNMLYSRVLLDVSSIQLTNWFNRTCFVVITAMSLSSFTYYGADYLVGSSLGFVADDHGFEWMRYELVQRDKEFEYQQFLDEPEAKPSSNLFPEIAKSRPREESVYEIECSNYPPESRWKNIEDDRTRITEESSKRAKNLRKVERLDPLIIANYDPRLQKYEDEKALRAKIQEEEDAAKTEEAKASEKPTKTKKKKVSAEEYNQFESTTDLFARPNVYVSYKDSRHKDYDEDIEVHYIFRQRFFENPVYKALIKLDMYPFLLGAHRDHAVSAEDEYELLKLKELVYEYANSVLDFDENQATNSVGFGRRITNHQFKGSLNVIRRFEFAKIHETVDRDPGDPFYNEETIDEMKKKKVLKYDQLLPQKTPDQDLFPFHEEVGLATDKFDDDLVELRESGNQSAPMYIGWDGSLRKFLVKTRVNPYKFETGDELYTNPYTIYSDKDLQDEKGKIRQMTAEEKEEYAEHSSYFPTGESKKLKEMPTYYSFQAWSPATENIKPGDLSLNLPSANYTLDEMFYLKVLSKQIEPSFLKKEERMDPLQRDAVDHFFANLPNYNWFWGRFQDVDDDTSYQEDFEHEKNYYQYYNLGNTTPPRLQGFAWPGVRDPLVVEKLAEAGGVFEDVDFYLDYEGASGAEVKGKKLTTLRAAREKMED